jgi:hypothetical protein
MGRITEELLKEVAKMLSSTIPLNMSYYVIVVAPVSPVESDIQIATDIADQRFIDAVLKAVMERNREKPLVFVTMPKPN